MAAGKRLRLKLKYDSRPRLTGATGAETIEHSDGVAMSTRTPTQSPSAHNVSEILPSPYNNNDSTVPIPHQLNMSLPPLTQNRRRRSSTKGPAPNLIKRSASTPNVRGTANNDAGMSLADKRRNKLGYHRTSVACGHCRRRKIRCLLAPDDQQGRCSNCIRLKKECNFYPVDQQPPVERRPRTGSRPDGRSGTSNSSSSSPVLPSGHTIEQADQFNHYLPLPMSAHEFSTSMAPLSADTLSPTGRGLIPSLANLAPRPALTHMNAAPASFREFAFPHQHDRGSQQWESPFFDHSPSSTGPSHPPSADPSSASSAYWRLHEPPMTPVYSPHYSGPMQTLPQHSRDANGGYTQFSSIREDPGWPLPTRSMSFDRAEDLQMGYQHPQNHYHQPVIDFRHRTGSDLHPPSLQASGASSATSMSEGPSARVPTPLTSTPATSQPHHFSFPPVSWNTLPGQHPMSKGPDYDGYYSEMPQTHLARVHEEEIMSPFGGDHTGVYSSGGESTAIYSSVGHLT